jgi:hypothetical protein
MKPSTGSGRPGEWGGPELFSLAILATTAAAAVGFALWWSVVG